jgi:hypothetical protein
MAGVLTYLAVFTLTSFWVLGWAGASYVAGAFFDLPMKTTILVGATLGPLGFVVTIATGILERGSRKGLDQMQSPMPSNTPPDWDPFA